MHLLVRETRSLDEEEAAVDLGQSPADLVFLSFADSDLGAAATAWQAMGPQRPSLRLANLARLRHPMSVDLYAEQVIAHTRCAVVRLLGGLEYWRYGAEEFSTLCRQLGIALAIVSGDERHDARLTELSTVPGEELLRLEAYLRHGSPANVAQALKLAARLGGLADGPDHPPAPLPRAGQHPLAVAEAGTAGSATIVFYRSHLLAGDTAAIEALAEALAARGLGVRAIYVSSLKDAEAAAFVSDGMRRWNPSVVLNATGFSARQDGLPSPLEAADAPVLQLVLAGTARAAWQASTRGLSQTDLAMQVVLPELDGRLLTTAIAFKAEAARVAGLDFARTTFRPESGTASPWQPIVRPGGQGSPPPRVPHGASRWFCRTIPVPAAARSDTPSASTAWPAWKRSRTALATPDMWFVTAPIWCIGCATRNRRRSLRWIATIACSRPCPRRCDVA